MTNRAYALIFASRYSRIDKTCGRQRLRNLKWYGLLRQTISLQFFFKSCLQQILPSPFLNTFTLLFSLAGKIFLFKIVNINLINSQRKSSPQLLNQSSPSSQNVTKTPYITPIVMEILLTARSALANYEVCSDISKE